MRRVDAGSPETLGFTLSPGGANVAVYSAHAQRIELCLFSADGATEVERITLPERTGDVWHGFVGGVAAGARYGLRAHGPYAPLEGHRFNATKLLVDPYARAIDRAFALHPSMLGQRADGSRNDDDSALAVPKAIAVSAFVPHEGARPRVPWPESVLYELHVRGFTKRHPGVPVELRGTCAGLAHPAAIDHLVRLGITAVELLPIAAAIDEPHLVRAGLSNYWGYNTIAWFTPDPRLAPGGIDELRACVTALHAAGIEVLLDVVFNHSGEGDDHGPTLSLRGLDNATYYRAFPGAAQRYVNDSGCGNTLALDRAPVQRLALDALRYYAQATGVDGFRFDLATTLGRRDAGFDPHAPLLAAIGADPLLRDLKLIAEPWDIGPGGYQAGAFPAPWAEWNDQYRDTVRKFWRGDDGLSGALATRLAGSADVFAASGRAPSHSVNFITAHDGFTLADLVSFAQKHNEANGEGNRDGTNENWSWNHGVVGATDDARIVEARRRDVRALLATLLFSRGTPMLTMGDELGHSQDGNNNAYAQDNALTWLDWEHADLGLATQVAALIRIRRQHPALHADRWLSGKEGIVSGMYDVEWLRPDGTHMTAADWTGPWARTLSAVFYTEPPERPRSASGPAEPADRVMVAIHAGDGETHVRLPVPRDDFAWYQVADTARVDAAPEPAQHGRITLAPRSVAVVVETVRPGVADLQRGAHHIADREMTRPRGHGSRTHRTAPAMTFPRSAGILLHPTSLPGANGIGEIGPEAHWFLDFLAHAGMKIWQMLPLGPTGYGDSPYQCFSAFAGNPMLIHMPGTHGDFPAHTVDFARVIPHKQALLRHATAQFTPDDQYRTFVQAQAAWLEDYALFMALKQAHGGVSWTAWDEGAARRDPAALTDWREKLAAEIEHFRREQFLFFTQFHALKRAATERGIRLMGDLPIYVAHDSADVWANPELFKLDAKGHCIVQAGVPPDYFSATGQLWGNPIYDWDAMGVRGYDWWIARMRAAFELFDVVRIDHFRGFEAYWEVPGADTTAVNGRWVHGPGKALFTAIENALGKLPIVAENLGLITPEVEALRERFGYPGMSILQFAFGTDGSANDFQPHNYPRERVVYTGTHDNDTTVGWWNSTGGGDSTRSADDVAREKDHAMRYLGTDGREMHWTLMRTALASVASTVLFPLQDVIGLGSEARMNLPGRQSGNWQFRFSWDQLTSDNTRRLRALVDLYER